MQVSVMEGEDLGVDGDEETSVATEPNDDEPSLPALRSKGTIIGFGGRLISDSELPPFEPGDGTGAIDPDLDTMDLKSGLREVRVAQRTRGSQFGHYVIEEELGRGGMGVVYAAHDPHLHRQVAIKVLHTSGAGNRKEGARLLREAQSMARLSHPHVVTVYEVGTVSGEIFLAMELIRGTTLRQWLETPRPWRAIVETMICAGRGLAAAHKAGIIHRDFKPDNVLIDHDGRARVTDFGLARACDSETTAPAADRIAMDDLCTTLSRTGHRIGTPAYMAPEQHGQGAIDARCDQFSFCVALYEGLFGEHPFRGDNLAEVMHRVITGERHPLPRRRNLPSQLVRAVLRGLSLRPADRFESMDDLLAALESCVVVREPVQLSIKPLIELIEAAAEVLDDAATDELMKALAATVLERLQLSLGDSHPHVRRMQAQLTLPIDSAD